MQKPPSSLPAFLWHFLRPHRLGVLGLVGTGVFWALEMSFKPYLIKLLVDGIVAYGETAENLFNLVVLPAIFYVVLLEANNFNYRMMDFIKLRLIPNLERNISASMFDYLERHSYQYFQNQFAGNLSNKVMDMARGAGTIVERMETFFSHFTALIIASILLFFIHPFFALAFVLWAALFLSGTVFLSKRSHQYSTIASESRSIVMGKIVDSLTNVINIHLFARNKYESEYLHGYLNDAMEKDRRLRWYLFKIKYLQGFSITLLVGGWLFCLIYYYSQGLITIGDFTFVLTLAMTIVWEVWRLADSLVGFSQELGICRQAIAIVTIPHEIVDAPRAKRLNISDGAIVFDKVSFHYVPGRDIFQNKTIEIQGGQRVGLVGSSGVGKTTFVNLILRFFNVQNGRILIDGQDISQVKRESLHEQIAMIPQDPGLFHRTLMENIRYGRLDATDEEVIAASQKGHCHEFIEQIEGGYQALVGERGIKLSGGQRQRIAISRAILKNAPILILDEATSALDSITEKYIQKSLEDLMRDRTTIAIAHRLSTLATMDRILVFKDGQIVEDGTHAKLLEQKSHYFHLWRMQVGGFLPRESNNGENSIV